MVGTGFPMPSDLFKQLKRKGLVVAGEHCYERQAYGKVIASQIPIAFLTPFGKTVAENELIMFAHPDERTRKLKKIAYRFMWRRKGAPVSDDTGNRITVEAFTTMSPIDLGREFAVTASKCLGSVEGQDFRIIQDRLFPGGIIAVGAKGTLYLE